ncbi:MAG: cell division protein FtsQ/DivIB [Alphaproteobacteria bacterium]|nr:cell division protein FtsQ/DivIB [Alphaproteobacteria bacterium]
MKRGLLFWLYFVVAIILAIYFATRTIMSFMGHGPVSVIRNVYLSADVNNKDLSGIVAAAGISPGTNTYSANLNVINARLLQIPGIKESAVRRLPNGNLTIRVKLYRAVASWTDGNYFYPLSADGTIVNQPSAENKPGAVTFRGEVPNDITEITKVATGLIGDLNYLEMVDKRRWNLYTNGGILVMLPETDPVTALGSLVTLNQKHKILNKNINTIDMRDPARILVK